MEFCGVKVDGGCVKDEAAARDACKKLANRLGGMISGCAGSRINS